MNVKKIILREVEILGPTDDETVRVKKYLEDEGYDGLYDGEGCGCGIDDLFACDGEGAVNCVPAFRRSCSGCRVRECWVQGEGRNDGCFHPRKMGGRK